MDGPPPTTMMSSDESVYPHDLIEICIVVGGGVVVVVVVADVADRDIPTTNVLPTFPRHVVVVAVVADVNGPKGDNHVAVVAVLYLVSSFRNLLD
jgi:hypothetical protein